MINRRTFLGAAALLAVPGVTTAPAIWASPQRRPRHETVELDDLRPSEATRVSTGPFTLLALTWDSHDTESGNLRFMIRTRAGDFWSGWSELHDDGHGPDPGTDEYETARPGTVPRLVRRSDAVEIRAGQDHIPPDLRVHLLDTTVTASGATAEASLAPSAFPAPPLGQPHIYTRADWDADESMRGEPQYGDVRGMFVHHTAGSNDYSSSDVPGIIRGIYEYHVVDRGWRDIGYNFLLDKYGRLWEGRYGGITKSVIGAHTRGYNTYSFGAAVLGTYMTKTPEQAVLTAYRNLIAWKFLHHGVMPATDVAYPDHDTLSAISGHRDPSDASTLCPGDLLWERLPSIRSAVLAAVNVPRHRTPQDLN